MLRNFILIFFILILRNFVFAQDAVEDSLTSVLLTSKEDSNKVKTYFELIKIVKKYDFDKATKLAKEQLTLSQKLAYPWGIGKSHNALGLIETGRKHSKLAIEHFMSGGAAFDSVKDYGNLSSIYSNISMVYSDGSIFMTLSDKVRNDSSIYFAKIADRYNEFSDVDSLKKLSNKMFIYGNLSTAYYNLNLHDSAIVYNDKSILVAEKLNRYDIVATCYSAIGTLFLLQKNYVKAINYLLMALILFEQQNFTGFVTKAKSDLAVAYFSKGDVNLSRRYLKESFKLALMTGDSTAISQNYVTSGLIELSENNYKGSIVDFEKGLRVCEKTKNKSIERQLWMGCAEAYTKIKNFDKALSMYNKALELSAGDYKSTYECYEALSSIYALKKNYEKAYKYLDEARILNSKLFDSTKSQIINELTVKYETGKKDNQISLLSKDQLIQKAEVEKQKAIKSSIFVGTLMLVVFSILGFVFYKRRRDINLKRREAELNAHITEVEMKALRSQMNPHFIFNSLRSINEYIQHNQSTLASEYLIKFAKLMRAILENSRKKEILISKDIEVLELYMQLESHRMEYPFNYSFEIDAEIDTKNTLIPPMLLQPIVENSIWHGLAPKGRTGRIVIRITKIKEMIHCEVEDDGVGRKFSSVKENEVTLKSESYGLKITEERLEIIAQLKKLETNLVFSDLNERENSTGLNVSFNLPYELNI